MTVTATHSGRAQVDDADSSCSRCSVVEGAFHDSPACTGICAGYGLRYQGSANIGARLNERRFAEAVSGDDGQSAGDAGALALICRAGACVRYQQLQRSSVSDAPHLLGGNGESP